MVNKLVPQFTVYLDTDALPSQQWVVVDYPTGLRFKGLGAMEAVDKWINWLQLDAGVRSKGKYEKGEL